MAIRNIRTLGDEILRKKAKEVTEMTPRIQELIDDMFETMYEANGVGLAARQEGIRKRLVVVDCGNVPIVLINSISGLFRSNKPTIINIPCHFFIHLSFIKPTP